MASILISLLAVFIMYKCCENFPFKFTWFIYTAYHTLAYCVTNGFSNFLFAVIFYSIIDLLIVFMYYKIYEHSENSFLKFFLLSLLVEIVVFFVISFILAALYMRSGANGILR